VILAVIALAAIALFFVTASQPTAAIPIAYDALLFLASLIGVVLAVIRVSSLPGLATDRAAGVWIALAGALGVTVGALISMRDERLSAPGRHVDSTGRPVPEPPEVETISPPPPAADAG
jgi:hypothetical protein